MVERVWQTHINLVPCLCQFRIYTFRCTFQPMVQQPARSNSVKWKLCTKEPQLIARCLHLINVVNEASGSDWISSKQFNFKYRQLTEVPHYHNGIESAPSESLTTTHAIDVIMTESTVLRDHDTQRASHDFMTSPPSSKTRLMIDDSAAATFLHNGCDVNNKQPATGRREPLNSKLLI